jgi:hypothetical protein
METSVLYAEQGVSFVWKERGDGVMRPVCGLAWPGIYVSISIYEYCV